MSIYFKKGIPFSNLLPIMAPIDTEQRPSRLAPKGLPPSVVENQKILGFCLV